jgi:plastocyanin
LAGFGGDSRGTTDVAAAPQPDSPASARNIPQAASPAPTKKTAQKEKHSEVVIDNFTFKPARLTVPVGTRVTWVNRDDVPHTATSTKKPRVFDSRTLDTDEKFSHVFTKPGTYEYFCALHPKMTAQIIVTAR